MMGEIRRAQATGGLPDLSLCFAFAAQAIVARRNTTMLPLLLQEAPGE